MKICYCFLIVLNFFYVSGQNLVPNPSFEFYSTCPDDQAQVDRAAPWFIPTGGTSDYYNACSSVSYVNVPGPTQIGFSSCYAHSGNGMTGAHHSVNVKHDNNFGTYREYIGVRLTNTLSLNTTYYVSFYVKLADSCVYAGNMGMYISKDSIFKSSYDTISVTPQISSAQGSFIKSKSQWTKVSGSFVSNGTEKYAYIGNFKGSIASDTFFVGPGTRNPIGNRVNNAYYFIDDVCISTVQNYCNLWTGIDVTSLNKMNYLYPNPFKNELTVEVEEACDLILIDITGRTVLSIKGQHGLNTINTSDLNAGVYIIQWSSNGNVSRFRVVRSE